MSVFSSWLASPPPDAAIEIAPEAVSVAVLGFRGPDPVVQGYAVAPLRPGAVVPSLGGANVVDREAVVGALKAACERAGVRPRRAALVIPDLAARVSVVRFEHIPAKAEDFDQLIRWQVKKSSPFPIEDACVTYSAGQSVDGGRDFVVVAARRNVVADYEGVCEQAGVYAGLVDVATLSVINLIEGGGAIPDGDWLVVHMRPDYTSVAIMRGRHLVFFRNRAEGEDEPLVDLVHQTAMYYQDRLQGKGFSRVLLGGAAREAGAVTEARQDLEQRLGVAVEPIDATQAASLADRVTSAPELTPMLAPLVGILLRATRDTVHA